MLGLQRELVARKKVLMEMDVKKELNMSHIIEHATWLSRLCSDNPDHMFLWLEEHLRCVSSIELVLGGGVTWVWQAECSPGKAEGGLGETHQDHSSSDTAGEA